MVAVRRLRPEEWPAYRELRLRALRDSPDAFGSTFEVESIKPDEYWAERVASAAKSQSQLLLVAEHGTDLVGLVWGWIDTSQPEIAHVFQMWVDPQARGRGCGTLLISAVVTWARDAHAPFALLRVTCGDTPARHLYERAGFVPFGDPEPLRPGSLVLAQSMTLDL